MGITISTPAAATSDSPWLSTTNPDLINDGIVAKLPRTTYPGINCTDSEFTYRARTWDGFIKEFKSTQCAVYTQFGRIGNSYLELSGTTLSGSVKLYESNQTHLTPIPNSGTALQMSIGTSNYMAFHDNLPQSIEGTFTDNNGGVGYKLAPANAFLTDRAGNKLTAAGLSFSGDSKWLVTDTKGKGIVRVNIATREVLPFHASPNYNLGFDPGLSTAISSDGRYALVYLSSSNTLRIIDLSTCSAVPDIITGPVSCEMKDMSSFLPQQISGYQYVHQPKFVSNNVVRLYVRYTDSNNVIRYAKYRMIAPGQTANAVEYLGLGDSFSSGEGAHNYYEGTDVENNKCHLSRIAYPYLIGQAKNYNSFESVACSGATTANVLTDPQYQYNATNPMPNPNPLGDMLPGSKQQLNVVEEKQPNIITLTMGGNDIGFEDILKKCTFGNSIVGTCFEKKEDRLELVRLINSKFDDLTETYSKLKNNSKADTKIYIAGYPRLAKDDGNCGVNVRLNNNEIKFSNQLIDYLNSVVKAAADNIGVRYVDVSSAFTDGGHRLCEADSGNIAINGLTAGQEAAFKMVGAESYHPNSLGHRLLKQKILSETSSLTQAMPTPNSSSTYPAESSTLPILNAPASGRTVKKLVFHAPIAPDVFFKAANQAITLLSDGVALKKNSTYTVELHSTPVNLGTFTSDNNGTLNASVTIPSTVPVGFHTLHIYGQNLAGENIDVYKAVYVAASDSDFDGDNIINSQDTCPSVTPTNQDIDQDSVDDGCDGYINDSPADINVLYRARNGNTSNGEDASAIYIERNIAKALSLLNIVDTDSDSDGWALVGKTDVATNGTVANFWIEDKGPQENQIGKYIPHVSIRSTESGCLQFKPSSLAAVSNSDPRTVVVETENANTCRSALPSADTDDNGVADNQQALYRARNGIMANGESADSVYIERNIAASEAILGISDYDSDADGWAVIAETDSNTDGVYADLVLVDINGTTLSSTGTFTAEMLALSQDEKRSIAPVVAVSQGTATCTAVKPSSLGFVAQGQIRTVASTMLPSTLSCT